MRTRSCFTALLGACLLFLVPLSNADITVTGGSTSYQQRIEQLLASSFSQVERSRTQLTILLGAAAFQTYCESPSGGPVLVVYVYRSQVASLEKDCLAQSSVLVADAPSDSLDRLAKSLFPGMATAMLGATPASSDFQYRYAVDSRLPVPPEGVARGLGRLIEEGGWRVFLMPLDPSIYQPTDYRLAIETLLRARRPTLVTVEGLLMQGAAAAAFYSSNQIDQAIVDSISGLIGSGQLKARAPNRVSIAVNKDVLRNFFGRVITDSELLKIDREVNGG
ncbi:MAG: hypothetical protein AAF098_06760 [Pseudomonadota bacterium]